MPGPDAGERGAAARGDPAKTGQASDIEIHARETIALRRRLDEIYAHHTGQTVERITDDMERDRFFTAEQAREYGLIDRVIESHELSRVATGFRPGGGNGDGG